MLKQIFGGGRGKDPASDHEGSGRASLVTSPPKRIITCESAAEYVACIFDLREFAKSSGCPSYPVLVDERGPGAAKALASLSMATTTSYMESPSLENVRGATVAELIGQCNRAAEAMNAPRSRCLLFGEDMFSLVGAAYAVATGRRIHRIPEAGLDELDETWAGVDSVVAVTSPTFLTRVSLHRLSVQIDGIFGDEREPSWGLLTAANAVELSWILAGIRLREPLQERGARIYSYDPPLDPLQHSELERVDIHGLEGGLLAETGPRSTAVLALAGHSNGYCFRNGLLCSGDVREDGERVCVGGMDCFVEAGSLGTPITQARDLRSDVILLSSCLGANFKLSPVPTSNLVMALLGSGPTAVLAPFTTHVAYPLSPYLFWEYARRGYLLGRATSRLNRVHEFRKGVVRPFLLFGDPDLEVFRGPPVEPKELEAVRESETSWSLGLPGNPPGLAVYVCRAESLAEAARRSVLHGLLDVGGPSEVLVEVYADPSRSGVDILVLWNRQPPRTPCRLHVVSEHPLDASLLLAAAQVLDCSRALVQSLDRGNVARDRELADGEDVEDEDPVMGPIDGLESLLEVLEPTLVQHHNQPILDRARYLSLRQVEERVVQSCEHANRAVADAFRETFRDTPVMLAAFSDQRGVSLLGEEICEMPCPRCGGVLQRRHYQVGFWRALRREVFECEGCEILCDVPDGTAKPVLQATKPARLGSWNEVSLWYTNDTDVPVFLTATLTAKLRKGLPGEVRIDPESSSTVLKPGATFNGQFHMLAAGGVPAHVARLKAVLAVNGNVAFASQMVEFVR